MRDDERISDQELLVATMEGDEAAFREFMGRYRNQITNYIHRMVDDHDRADFLAQETFVRVFMNVEEAQAQQGFSTFIYKIAHDLTIEELRRRKKLET